MKATKSKQFELGVGTGMMVSRGRVLSRVKATKDPKELEYMKSVLDDLTALEKDFINNIRDPKILELLEVAMQLLEKNSAEFNEIQKDSQ